LIAVTAENPVSQSMLEMEAGFSVLLLRSQDIQPASKTPAELSQTGFIEW